MQKARLIAGLTKNRNQGGGDSKQGLTPRIGKNVFVLSEIKKNAAYCKCPLMPMALTGNH